MGRVGPHHLENNDTVSPFLFHERVGRVSDEDRLLYRFLPATREYRVRGCAQGLLGAKSGLSIVVLL